MTPRPDSGRSVSTTFLMRFLAIVVWLLLLQWLFRDPVDLASVTKISLAAAAMAGVAGAFQIRRRAKSRKVEASRKQ